MKKLTWKQNILAWRALCEDFRVSKEKKQKFFEAMKKELNCHNEFGNHDALDGMMKQELAEEVLRGDSK